MKNHWQLGITLDLGTYPKNQEMFFSPNDIDTEDNYNKNTIKHWPKYSVKYKFNSHGFRSREFKIDNPDPTILVFGCSHTVGVGVMPEDSWPEHFLKYFPHHVVYNAGIGGASADTVARFACNMIPIIKPDIVAIFWPSLYRFETYTGGPDSDEPRHNGNWNAKQFKTQFEDNNSYNNQSKNKLIIQMLKSMYNFKLVELDVDNEFSIRDPGSYLKARDGVHLCGWWHRDVADDFYKEYIKNENISDGIAG